MCELMLIPAARTTDVSDRELSDLAEAQRLWQLSE